MPCGVGFSLRIRLPGLGVARATSPDARYVDQSAYGGSVPAALRSLGGNLAFATGTEPPQAAWSAALGFLRRLHGTGNPSLD